MPDDKDDSVLKEKPLRYAGQSLDEMIDDHLSDKIQLHIAAIYAFTLLCIGLMVGHLTPGLWWKIEFLVLNFFVVIPILIFYLRRQKKILRNLRQGRDGERRVGQELERLRTDGYVVFHDIQGKGFNVDHVIVGPAGVFAIETKTWGKKESRKHKIEYNGDAVRNLDSENPIWDPAPVIQAKSQAKFIADMVERVTGKREPVLAILLFVDRYVVLTANTSQQPVQVLNPKMLQGRLRNYPSRLGTDRIRQIELEMARDITSAPKA